MSNIKSGLLAGALAQGKHLRPEEKRKFWKRHRKAEATEAKSEAGIGSTFRKAFTRLGRDI